MHGRTSKIEWRSGDDAAALKRLYLGERDAAVKPRLHLLWLMRQGKQIAPAARLVGVDPRSATRWMRWYADGGVEMVRQRKSCGVGQASRLSGEQQEALLERVAEGDTFTAWQAGQWIKQQFGAVYTEGGVYSLFKRLGIKKRVPRPMNAKASDEVQEAYKKGDAPSL